MQISVLEHLKEARAELGCAQWQSAYLASEMSWVIYPAPLGIGEQH